MKKSVALPFVALALASTIAVGCSGNGNVAATASGTPTPFPSPTASCTPPPGYTIEQVFPQNIALPGNSGLLAANLQGVVFAISPSPLPTNWYIYATSTYGSTAFTNSVGFLATPVPVPGSTASSTPTPLPTPSDTPIPNAIFETASIGTFANNTTFQIYLANTNCYPGLMESSFKTTLTDSPTATPSPSPTASAT